MSSRPATLPRPREYLEVVARWASGRVVGVTTAVRVGRPVDSVLDQLEANDSALVVVSSHGRTGIRGAVIGSVTADLIRRSQLSVVAIQSANST